MKLNIFKVVDRFGWAHYYTTKEQIKYTRHNISYSDWVGTLRMFDSLIFDIFYIPSPTLCQDEVRKLIARIQTKYPEAKIVGSYTGLINTKYSYADLQLPISIIDIQRLKNESVFPVTFLPESVDTEYYLPEINKDRFELGWAGRAAVDKRIHLLDSLILSVKRQSAHGEQYFKDGRDPKHMLDFYHSIDCLVLTSSHECMPRVVLEAMSCGLPVVATRVGSIPWLLDKEWIVPVEPENVVMQEMNKKLKILLENPELRVQVGQRNREWVEKWFGWKNTQPLWDDVFEALYTDNFQRIDNISNTYLQTLNQDIQVQESKDSYQLITEKKQLKILKVIDVFGWAFDFIYKEQRQYTKHRLSRNIVSEVARVPHANDYDIVYFSGANLTETRSITREFKLQNTKIIGAYAGENYNTYQEQDLDLVISISYPFTQTLKEMYPTKTVIFMPEGVNTKFFIPLENKNYKSFIAGWAGRKAIVKRPYLLNQLKYPIKIKSDTDESTFVKERTQDSMLEFYHSIDALVLVSKSECMPRVILEAMSCGLPVVSTNVGSINMLLDKDWLIDAIDEEEIVKIMNQKLDVLKNNPKLRKEIGERNRQHVEEYFSWAKIMPLWDDLFTVLYNNDYETIKKISNNFITTIYQNE